MTQVKVNTMKSSLAIDSELFISDSGSKKGKTRYKVISLCVKSKHTTSLRVTGFSLPVLGVKEVSVVRLQM